MVSISITCFNITNLNFGNIMHVWVSYFFQNKQPFSWLPHKFKYIIFQFCHASYRECKYTIYRHSIITLFFCKLQKLNVMIYYVELSLYSLEVLGSILCQDTDRSRCPDQCAFRFFSLLPGNRLDNILK
jgi:hypothetical protein